MIATPSAIAFSDLFPVTGGHTLVIPRRHVTSIFDLPKNEFFEIWALVSDVRTKINELDAPGGFNIGINDGAAAGQTIPHAHIHVIPRRIGDVQDPRGGIRWVIAETAKYW
jgi:diadenosine tetraphosphate (Ap4A) HIT family hydrolase